MWHNNTINCTLPLVRKEYITNFFEEEKNPVDRHSICSMTGSAFFFIYSMKTLAV